VKPDSSATMVFSACVLCWLVAYFGIVYRGFKDRTYGVPMAALAANLCWEGIYSFVLHPFSDTGHILSIPWFCIDLIIAAQCFRYGPNDVEGTFLRVHFRVIFASAVAVTFPIMYFSFKEFNDWYGEYTGAGDAFMMSVLFIALLTGRKGVGGQSMYIAVSKWLGTFLAYIATSLTVNTTSAHPWPESLTSFAVDTVRHHAYPLTPLINILYAATFFVDILYIVLLRSRLRELGFSPWRRI
jgi:hypothetical protein